MSRSEANWVSFSELNKLYYSSMLSGFSFVSSMCIHPLIVLTIRQQTGIASSASASSTSVLNQLRMTYKDIGLRGLYRGCLPLTTMTVPSNIVYYIAYESSREALSHQILAANPDIPAPKLDLILASSSSFFCSCLALVIYVPAEVTASKMIIQNRDGVGMTSMVNRVYQEKGVGGFYRGYSTSLVTGTVSSSSWWYAYSMYRRCAPEQLQAWNSVVFDACGGFLSGLVSASCSHPLDTLKTRIMTGLLPENSLVAALQNLARNGQLVSLWKGYVPNLVQTSMTSTFFAVLYELIKRIAS